MINEAIKILLKGKNLTFTEAKEAFDEIFSGLSTIIQSSSFISLLEAKKPSEAEINASIISARDCTKTIDLSLDNSSMIENISLDTNNEYLDFMLMNDLICASCDLNSLRYCFNAHSYSCLSFDILSKMGIKFKDFNFDFSQELERINLGYIYLSFDEPFYKYTYEIKKDFKFANILQLCEKLLNPYKAQNAFWGINSPDDVEKYAKIALLSNNKNTLLASGLSNLSFVEIEKETMIAEAWKNKVFSYKFSPEFVDIKRGNNADLKIENNEHCAQIFLDLIDNKIQGSIFDAVIINAGFALYISKRTNSLIEGIDLAKKTIKEGKLKEKFNQIKKFYS